MCRYSIASRPFRLRSKCSICSRRFESRRWSHWGQALSSGFLEIGQDHPSSLGPGHGSSRHCSAVEFGPLPVFLRVTGIQYSKWKHSVNHLSADASDRSTILLLIWIWVRMLILWYYMFVNISHRRNIAEAYISNTHPCELIGIFNCYSKQLSYVDISSYYVEYEWML